MGGSSLAPEVIRRTFRQRDVPRPRHDAPAGDPRPRGEARLCAHALRLGVEVGLDARDALAHRLLLGAERRDGERWVAITDPGSELEQLARERGFAAIFAGEPTIGGRYSALSRVRHRPGGADGVDLARLLDARARDGRGLPARRGQSRARARARRSARAGRPAATRSASSRARAGSGSGPSSCSPSRPASTARARSPRRASRPTGPTGRRRRCASRASTSSGRSSSAGSSRPPSPARSSASTRSTSPTCRRRRTRRTRCSPPASEPDVAPGGLGRRAVRSRREPGDYVCIQAFVDPTRRERAEGARRSPTRARRGDGLRRHARVRPALPALDRPAAQGRPADRGLSPGRRRHRGRARDPRPAVRVREADPRAGGRRLRVAAGARPPGRAHPDWRTSRCSSG